MSKLHKIHDKLRILNCDIRKNIFAVHTVGDEELTQKMISLNKTVIISCFIVPIVMYVLHVGYSIASCEG
jgi:hypothetical protein